MRGKAKKENPVFAGRTIQDKSAMRAKGKEWILHFVQNDSHESQMQRMDPSPTAQDDNSNLL